MRRTAKYLLIIALALLVLALALCWRNWRRNAGDGALARWGGRELTASEAAYYGDRISEIVNAWRQMGERAEHDEEGRLREPYHTFLGIDAGRREIWIEDRGQVLEEYHSELPVQMTWAVYHDAGSGATHLGNTVRLKWRGVDLARRYPEVLWVAGQGMNEYLALYFDGRAQGQTHTRGAGPFQPHHHATPRKQGVQYYGSVLADDAEYEQSRLSWTEASQGITSSRRLLTPLDENKAAWLKIRKMLHQAIEGQVRRAGFDLRRLQVRPGPDYSAAYAQIQVAKDGIIRNLLHRTMSLNSHLMIDYLGNDIWYARIARNPRPSVPRANRPDSVKELPLEFLVAADQASPASARRAWLERGRERQKESPPSRGRWTATLANRAVVSFLGIREHPGAGRRWWGPDGSPIDDPLCFPQDSGNYPVPYRVPAGRRGFEIAWRVQHEDLGKPQGLSVQHRIENGSIFDISLCCDRYGASLSGGHHESYTFKESQEKTTLTVDTNFNNQGLCTVRFKNLSLTPGKDQGFEIEIVQ